MRQVQSPAIPVLVRTDIFEVGYSTEYYNDSRVSSCRMDAGIVKDRL